MKFKFFAMAAAIVASASAAGAADLNKPAKVAVDYVRVCDAYGAGFFYIPGSDTCLKIGGRVYFDERVGGGTFSREVATNSVFGDKTRSGNTYFSRAAVYFNLDARTNTEFGLLRSYEELRVRYSTNSTVAGPTPELDLTNGYVQWGGLFAGKMRSAFDFTPAIASLDFDMVFFQTNTLLNQAGYTFAFGNGVTGTVALIDSTTGDATYNNLIRNQTDATADVYGGNKVPDVVANLNVTQAWGSAQIAAAYHQDYSLTSGQKAGYAFNGGVSFNLPMIAAGDTIVLQGGYSSGAEGYITAAAQGSAGLGKAFAPGSASYIGQDWALVGGSIKLTQTWGVIGSFHHVFNPNFQFDFDASYLSSNGYGARDTQTYGLSSDIKWLPTADPKFYIALEGEYGALTYSGATKTAFAATSFAAGKTGLANVSGWTAGVRINRNF